MLTFYITLLI